MNTQNQTTPQSSYPCSAALDGEALTRKSLKLAEAFHFAHFGIVRTQLHEDRARQDMEDFHRWCYSEREAFLMIQLLTGLHFVSGRCPSETIIAILYAEHEARRTLSMKDLGFLLNSIATLFNANYACIGEDKNGKATLDLTGRGLALGQWINRNEGNHYPPNELLLVERRQG